MKIPSNRQWTQTNEGDALGILHSTRNITLATPGKARVSQKSISIQTRSLPNPSGLERVVSFVYFDDQYLAIHTDGVLSFDLEGTPVGTTGIDPTTTIYGDGIMCYGLLHVTSNNDLHSYNGSGWTNGLETNTGSVPHPMEIFDALTTYKLAVGNSNTVKLLDSSYNNSTAVLTLPSQYIVTSLAYSNAYLYVGTRNKNGGDAKIFIWDGNGNNANYEVPVSSNWVYSVKPYKGSVAALTSRGELVYINGTTAERLAAFPVFFMPSVTWQGNLDDDVPRVFNRGMMTDGDEIYLNVNALVEQGGSKDYLPGFESGIWVYNQNSGLNHRASTNYDDVYVIDDSLSMVDSEITTSISHKLKSGDSVVFQSVSGLSGVDTATVYYAGVTGVDKIKLALSRRGVKDGEYITITGTAGASDKLVYTPNTEYYQYARVSSGAIIKPTAYDGYFKNWSTPIIWAGSAQNRDIASTQYTINILVDAYNVGVIETQRIYSDSIEQSWKKFYTFLDGLDMDNEKVIIKYRTEEALGYPTPALLGTWLNANTINFDREDCSFIQEGDEAMIIDGYGRGHSAHVLEVNNSSSTTSIVLDEDLVTTFGSVRVSFTNYKKAGTMTTENEVKNYLTSSIDTQSPWIQLKVELRGYAPAVNMFDLSNEKQKGSQ